MLKFGGDKSEESIEEREEGVIPDVAEGDQQTGPGGPAAQESSE